MLKGPKADKWREVPTDICHDILFLAKRTSVTDRRDRVGRGT